MTQPGFKIRALGEIAIRCRDFEAMTAFYRDMLGLEVLSGGHRGTIVFFRIAEGYGGHTAVLALFDEAAGDVATGQASSLHHLAFTVDRADQDRAEAFLASNGIETRIEEFAWIGWRGLFMTDPDGNTVELVAYDPEVGEPAP